MSSMPLTVYIVDDDNRFRESMEELVNLMGYSAVGFGSAEAFLKSLPAERPACLLLDVNLPGLDGLSLQRKLLKKEETLPIVFITGHGDVPMSVKAMKKGAVDFLLKPFNTNALRDAIVSALDRDMENGMEEEERKKIRALIALLTPREQDVMRQIITGKLNKQIADSLGTAEKTIRKHRGQVMGKLQVSSVADLVRMLEKVGIVHPAPRML